MTDPHLDELASAHLDGATTPEEAARIEADPELRARVEALRLVRDAVATSPPPADPARREAAIAAALAAYDGAERPAESSVVTPLRAPSARRGASPTLRRVLGAAAAVVLLALLVPLLGQLGESHDDNASFDSTGAALEGPTEALGSAEDDARTTTTAAGVPQDLGAFDDLDDLVTALSAPDAQAQVDRGAADHAAGETAFDSAACVPATAQRNGTTGLERATATVGDEAVIVVVRQGDDRARRVVVYRASDCQVLAEAQL